MRKPSVRSNRHPSLKARAQKISTLILALAKENLVKQELNVFDIYEAQDVINRVAYPSVPVESNAPKGV